MLDIFRKSISVRNTTGLKAPYELHNIMRMMEINKETVLSYYRYKSKTVDTKDLMVRILKHLGINADMDVFSLLEMLDISMGQIVRHFNIISTVSKGKEVNGNYYILEEDDNEYFSTNWEEFIPLRPILTEYDSLLMDHPAKMTRVVYVLNVKLLAIQYLLFLKSNIGATANIQEFVYRFVYTNSIPSFNSLAFLNRLLKDENNIYRNPHPFHMVDMNTNTYKVFKKFRHDLQRRTFFVKDLLLSFKTTNGTLLDNLRMEFQTFNSNNIKPFILIYAHYIWSILSLMNKSSKRYNRNSLNYFITFYRYGITSRMDTYPLTFIDEYKEEMGELVNFLKGRT